MTAADDAPAASVPVPADTAPADPGGDGREYRIDELANLAGVKVRTLRFYQERRLLPPPRHQGRIAWYSDAHLTRLRIIGQLLNRGHTLGGIAELLSAWERGHDIAELLGFERALSAPWSQETPVTLSRAELSERLDNQLTDEALELATSLGYLTVEGERVTMASARLWESTETLVQAGIPLLAVLTAGREVVRAVDDLASLFVDLFRRNVMAAQLAEGLPDAELKRLADVITRVHPVARDVVDVHLGWAMDRRVGAEWGDLLDAVATGRATRADGEGGGAADAGRQSSETP